MKKLFNYLRHRRDITLMSLALLLLIAAMFKPTVPIKRDVFSYVFVADITQSMNVVDTTISGKAASRHQPRKYSVRHQTPDRPANRRSDGHQRPRHGAL